MRYLEFHPSALRHGYEKATIRHAIEHALIIRELESEAEPRRMLALGPDRAGNLLEVIWIEVDDNRDIVIHAMAMRRAWYRQLRRKETQT